MKTLGICAAVLLVAWFAIPVLLGFKSWGWHQRLVLEINTPNGLVSGGSTIAAGVSFDPKWIPATGGSGHSWIKGESSFVEVLPGKYLFAVLNEQGETDRAVQSFASQLHAFNGTAEQIFRGLEMTHGTGRVPRPYYPALVTFDDLNDPSSVGVVDPDHLDTVFGPGITLNRITLEISNRRITRGALEGVLKWIPKYYATRFGQRASKLGDPDFLMVDTLTSGALRSGNFTVRGGSSRRF